MNSKFMCCPICGEEHDVMICEEETLTIIKGEEVTYTEIFYHCDRYDDENDFMTGSLLNRNLQEARNAYQRKISTMQNEHEC